MKKRGQSSPLCRFCFDYCCVPMPPSTPCHVRAVYIRVILRAPSTVLDAICHGSCRVTIQLPSCPGGQAYDRLRTGYNLDYIRSWHAHLSSSDRDRADALDRNQPTFLILDPREQ